MWGKILLILVLGGGAALVIGYAVVAWSSMGVVEMGFHGWLALILGVVLTLAIGVALMGLVFYSSRKGYDERHHHHE